MKSLCLSLCVRCSVFGEEPDLTREGGSIPVTLTLEEVTGKNVMLLPIGACDDGAHSQNEKINRCNYIKGVLNAVHHYCLVISRDVKSSASRPKKTGIGLDGNSLGLETLLPRPHVIQPRRLVYCNVLISYSVAINCKLQLNIGNFYCKVSYDENQGWQRRY